MAHPLINRWSLDSKEQLPWRRLYASEHEIQQLWEMAPLVLGFKHRTHQVPWKGAEEICVDKMRDLEEKGPEQSSEWQG